MSNTTKNISETRASRDQWNEIRSKVSPGLLAKFDGGEIAVYADRAGTQRILPPIGRVVRDMSAATSPRPEPQTPTRTASDEVLEEVRALSGVFVEDGVMREIERAFGTADTRAATTTTPTQASTSTRVASDDALEAVKQLGASDDALDEVAAIAKGGA